MNTILNNFLNYPNGIYIEAGANDGLAQSNTYTLQTQLNWKGILIEPSKYAYDLCKINRPGNIILQTALIADSTINSINGDFDGNLMSSVSGARLNRNFFNTVSATTLNSILKMYNPKANVIDYLSLDVEGFELNVLKGLDFDKFTFKFLQIEINYLSYSFGDIIKILEKDYYLYDNITKYTKKTNPGWDGTHNDYFFINKKLC